MKNKFILPTCHILGHVSGKKYFVLPYACVFELSCELNTVSKVSVIVAKQ